MYQLTIDGQIVGLFETIHEAVEFVEKHRDEVKERFEVTSMPKCNKDYCEIGGER